MTGVWLVGSFRVALGMKSATPLAGLQQMRSDAKRVRLIAAASNAKS